MPQDPELRRVRERPRPGTLLVMTMRDTAPGAGCWRCHTDSEPESKTAFSLHTSCEPLFGHLESECVRASRYRRPKRAIERTGRDGSAYEGSG